MFVCERVCVFVSERGCFCMFVLYEKPLEPSREYKLLPLTRRSFLRCVSCVCVFVYLCVYVRVFVFMKSGLENTKCCCWYGLTGVFSSLVCVFVDLWTVVFSMCLLVSHLFSPASFHLPQPSLSCRPIPACFDTQASLSPTG